MVNRGIKENKKTNGLREEKGVRSAFQVGYQNLVSQNNIRFVEIVEQ